MSVSDTWCRPSVWGCSAVHCVIGVQEAERCLLSPCPGVFPTGMFSAITGSRLGGWVGVSWAGPTWAVHWVLHPGPWRENKRRLCAPYWKLTWVNSGAAVCSQPSRTRDRRQWKVPWIHTHWFQFWAINEKHWDDCRTWHHQRTFVSVVRMSFIYRDMYICKRIYTIYMYSTSKIA